MKNALIGYTGFVGNSLIRQWNFDEKYRSTNIHEIENCSFDNLVCAGASAKKWLANNDPENDLKGIQNLINRLKSVKCNRFILISTVDVFKQPINVDENSMVDEEGLNAYGLHRRYLEKFVEENFENHLIIRLPGLIGPGLQKNAIFDLLNDNNTGVIDSRNVFQFYPTVNLGLDIETAIANNLKLVHLTAEPISVAEIADKGFCLKFENECVSNPVKYDFRTIHANLFQSSGNYQYNKQCTILAVRTYAQAEPKTVMGTK